MYYESCQLTPGNGELPVQERQQSVAEGVECGVDLLRMRAACLQKWREVVYIKQSSHGVCQSAPVFRRLLSVATQLEPLQDRLQALDVEAQRRGAGERVLHPPPDTQ